MRGGAHERRAGRALHGALLMAAQTAVPPGVGDQDGGTVVEGGLQVGPLPDATAGGTLLLSCRRSTPLPESLPRIKPW